ncbi:FtsJ-like methyltransferase-domain-containing protein [Gaertneriomyces semiglobifer]|nr:FtsJ-like methyltransferase-domain-containing protein [Gaertneriomyces semiglobifer]
MALRTTLLLATARAFFSARLCPSKAGCLNGGRRMSMTRPSDWYRRQSSDQFVHKRITEGYRSRAAFKLLEIQQRYKVMKPGGVCLELGGAPGGWAQVAVEIIRSDGNNVEPNLPSSKSTGHNGCVVSIDLLPMDPIPGVHILQGDVTQPEDLEAALNVIKEVTTTPLEEGEAVRPISKPGAYGHIDTLLSDLSHSHTGNRSLDSLRMEELNSLTLQVALYPRMLKQGGSFVCKVFDSAEARAFQKKVGNWFKTTKWVKPSASRSDSREGYLVALGFKGSKAKG